MTIATLKITLDESGQINVEGQSPDPSLFFLMMEQAKVSLLQQALKNATRAVQPASGPIPPFGVVRGKG